jgi:hypothetical protein
MIEQAQAFYPLSLHLLRAGFLPALMIVRIRTLS